MKIYFSVRHFVLLCIAGLVITTSANAEERHLKVGYIEFPPMYSTENGSPRGILLDIGRTIFNELGYSYRETSYPTRRLFKALEVGMADIWFGIRIPRLKSAAIIGDQPIYTIQLNVYGLDKVPEAAKKEDFKGKRVVIMLGYTYSDLGAFIRDKSNGVSYVEAKSHQQALRLLKTGRFDYLLDYQYPLNAALKKVPLENIRANTIARLPVYIYVSRRTRNPVQLSATLDSTFARLSNEGKLNVAGN
ncbi:substrate-binding periplasmic protein [Marinobacterium jannaschii]|uniref:substrate-binding periplasmic protein n=1 Tax=Marinobacterium jannaschii TaxID=64970 RepID=UPI0004887481|nr:transporter substrate-binding domain-containing protein [Marinobacterium jannaschii]